MKLSRFGKLQMNNPARAAAQRRYTARHMLRLGGDLTAGTALELGCGRGVGAEVILTTFAAAKVVALDVDPEMVDLARLRLASFGDRARVYLGDATAISELDETFDGVFDFGVIHQIEGWQEAVAEVARVLKPGGHFYFEAVSTRFYRFAMNLAMERGAPDVRKIGFGRDSYLNELAKNGIEVGENYIEPRLPITSALIGDLIGVGTRSA
jgi:ubiquinone/menaquinone biosynthesis C-methylase UbiE